MALLAESFVEEWLNRQGFFTIRGVKHGVREMDILAIRHEPSGRVIGWHVEVQVSFRPVGYICKLTNEIVGESNRKKTSAKQRTDREIDICAAEWVEQKFFAKKKRAAREQLWPGLNWGFYFIHGVVREKNELEKIRSKN